MLDEAVKRLLAAYDKADDIENIKAKREFVNKQLKIFTKEGLDQKFENAEKEKPINNTAAEIMRYNKLLTEYSIYKIQYEAYMEMNQNIDRYEDIEKNMNKQIKKARALKKDVIRIHSSFENMSIDW